MCVSLRNDDAQSVGIDVAKYYRRFHLKPIVQYHRPLENYHFDCIDAAILLFYITPSIPVSLHLYQITFSMDTYAKIDSISRWIKLFFGEHQIVQQQRFGLDQLAISKTIIFAQSWKYVLTRLSVIQRNCSILRQYKQTVD